MTSRTVPPAGNATPVAGPGDRPHLPPVPATGTTSRRSDRKTPLGWLPWLLLGLLLLTLLAAALLARAADGSGSAAGSDSAASQGSGSDSSSSQGGAAGSDGAAKLTAGGQDLLAVRDGKVGSLEGQQAEGTATVESVVADEGFWVGQSADQRVFVFLTPEARRSAGESGFRVEAGQTVSLTGVVKAASPEFAQSAGVTDAEGAAQLVEQGGYVEASQVRLAQ